MDSNKPDISIIIITLARQTLYCTLDSLVEQEINKTFEIVLINQGQIDKKKLDKIILKGKSNKTFQGIRVFNYEKNLGFGKYRNEGIKCSKGKILAWTDDDTWTMNCNWLNSITKPIFDNKYLIVTSGVKIALTGNYFEDCISLLGYPAGGALGFEKMWKVNSNSETDHCTTCNLAFHGKIDISFNEKLRRGTEDADFSRRAIEKKYKIYFCKDSIIWHVSRKGLFNFVKWHFLRGQASAEYKIYGKLTKKQWRDKFFSIKNIFINVLLTKYIFGIILLFFIQYFVQFCGYSFFMFKNKK